MAHDDRSRRPLAPCDYFFEGFFSPFTGALADSLKGNTNRPRRTHPGAPGSHSFLRLLQKVFRKCLHS